MARRPGGAGTLARNSIRLLDLPFETLVLGVPVSVERLELTAADAIVAVCRRVSPVHARQARSPWRAFRTWSTGACLKTDGRFRGRLTGSGGGI